MKTLRSLSILFILLCLLAGMLSFTPARVAQAGPETVTPAGLSAGDWAQIEKLLSQRAYLKASNTGASDEFGYSVAISGDTVVVGAYNEDSSATGVNGEQNDNSAVNSGAAYVFTRDGTTWSQEAYLKASNAEAGDNFGYSVAIFGDTIVVGAYGEDSASPIVNGDQNDNSTPSSGAAYVFVRSGTAWSQQAYLKSATILRADMFGNSVAISGDTVVVGAYGEDSMSTGVNSTFTKKASLAGAAYVFTRDGTTWSQQAYLKASNTELGDYFGWSVAVSGDTVVVGAFGEDSHATGMNGDQTDNSAVNSGAAYVFTRDGTTWSQQAYLKASNTGASDQFGFSAAIAGDTVVIGAEYEDSQASGVNGDENDDSATDSGAAYVFTRDGTIWSQQAYLKASNTGASDQFGFLVAISGDMVVVGAPYEDSQASGVNGDQNDNSAINSGAAYVFTRDGTTWGQQAFLKASNTGAYDYFGFSLAIAGDTVIVAAPYEDSNASGVNGDQNNNSTANSGAAYVFTQSLPVSNDDFDTPVVISNVPFTTNQDSISATTSVDDPNFQCGSGNQGWNSVWYTFTPSQNGTLTASTEYTNFNTVLALWTGTRGSLTSVACNDDYNGIMYSRVDVSVQAGVTYFIEIAGYRYPYSAPPSSGTLYLSVDFAADPTTQTRAFRSVGAKDGWILETGENTNKGGDKDDTANTLRLGDDSANKQYRSILSFATGAGLPDDAVITKVTLKVRKQGITGGGDPVTTFQGFMVNIKQGVFGIPALQASDFQAVADKTYGPFNTTLSGGWYNIDLSAGAAAINKVDGGLTQIRLRFKLDDNNNIVPNYLSLYSGNATTAANHPQLIIEYSIP